MVISMEEYAALRKDFIKVAKFHIKTAALNQLKIIYQSEINSTRVSDDIEDIEALIRVLEKRNVLRYNNIKPLKDIAKLYLRHSAINDKLENYDIWVKGYTPPYSPRTNLYQLKNVHYNPEPSAPPFQEVPNVYSGTSGNLCAGHSSQLNQNGYGVYSATRPTTGPLQTLSDEEARLQTRIFVQVSKRMGKFWLDVARRLDIRECDINNIDKQYPDLEAKAYAALKLFADETNLRYWQSTLKKALEKARRKDLAEKVEEIANHK